MNATLKSQSSPLPCPWHLKLREWTLKGRTRPPGQWNYSQHFMWDFFSLMKPVNTRVLFSCSFSIALIGIHVVEKIVLISVLFLMHSKCQDAVLGTCNQWMLISLMKEKEALWSSISVTWRPHTLWMICTENWKPQPLRRDMMTLCLLQSSLNYLRQVG